MVLPQIHAFTATSISYLLLVPVIILDFLLSPSAFKPPIRLWKTFDTPQVDLLSNTFSISTILKSHHLANPSRHSGQISLISDKSERTVVFRRQAYDLSTGKVRAQSISQLVRSFLPQLKHNQCYLKPLEPFKVFFSYRGRNTIEIRENLKNVNQKTVVKEFFYNTSLLKKHDFN